MRKSSKGFKRRPRQTLTEGQLTKSKRTIDDIANFFMEIREGDNIQRLLSKRKKDDMSFIYAIFDGSYRVDFTPFDQKYRRGS